MIFTAQFCNLFNYTAEPYQPHKSEVNIVLLKGLHPSGYHCPHETQTL